MRIAQLRQRLRDLGAKPCHEDRLLRGWSQVFSYDRKHSPAETFFPLALRNELPAIEAELDGLARLRCEYPANGHGMDTTNNHGSHDRSTSPTLSRKRERGQTWEALFNSGGRGSKRSATRIFQ